MRRWLGTYGPGTLRDIQWWTGWTVAATKRALAAVGAVEVALDDGTRLRPREMTLSAPPIQARGSRCCPRSTRRRWPGRSDPGTSAAWSVAFSTPPATPGPRSGSTGGSWADGRSARRGEIVYELLEDVGREASTGRSREEAARLEAWINGRASSRASGRRSSCELSEMTSSRGWCLLALARGCGCYSRRAVAGCGIEVVAAPRPARGNRSRPGQRRRRLQRPDPPRQRRPPDASPWPTTSAPGLPPPVAAHVGFRRMRHDAFAICVTDFRSQPSRLRRGRLVEQSTLASTRRGPGRRVITLAAAADSLDALRQCG